VEILGFALEIYGAARRMRMVGRAGQCVGSASCLSQSALCGGFG